MLFGSVLELNLFTTKNLAWQSRNQREKLTTKNAKVAKKM